jgi:hypothetical protein
VTALSVVGSVHSFLFFLGLVVLGVDLWALIDASIRPAPAYVSAGKRTKGFWVAVLAAAAAFFWIGFFALIGLVAAIVYLVDVRPALREVSGGRGSGGGPYGGWQ